MKKVHGFAREDELRNFFTSNNQWQSRFVPLSDNSTTSSAKKICRNSTNPSFEKSWCCQRSFDIPEISQDGTGSVARAEQTPGVPCMDPSEWNCKAVPKEGDVTITLGQGDLLRPHQEIFQSKPWHAWRTMKPRCPPEPGKTSLNIFKTESRRNSGTTPKRFSLTHNTNFALPFPSASLWEGGLHHPPVLMGIFDAILLI